MDMDCATLSVALCEKTINQESKLTIKEPDMEPDKWFVCSFCYEIIIEKPSFMVGTHCVCELCKADDELINEISQEDRIDLDELYEMCGQQEYRGDKKEESDEEIYEEIDSNLFEIFKEDISNVLYGEGASDDEE
jgi:hypothetical protein